MPHQCTNCGRTFADGSKEMLSGCPDCGGNKFQFRPADADGPASTVDPTTGGSPDDTAGDAPGGDGPAGPADGEAFTGGADEGDVAGSAESAETARTADEDGAQASARSEVVSEDEIAAAAGSTGPGDGPGDDPAGDDPVVDEGETEAADPDLDALRRKLNDQFESIRIVSPGKYELNLMELYDREEYIISLREDGRYVIEMPEGWDDR
ncbi:OapC/ArvC family zinc-ribbon domain-containing protein [Halobaculum sp. EA56]|uniref:OapC/ArvC family zinc-ribbon domain-containing protein n=1 Tax=Halobaculum sp. EA56 TaxID=3421648 RepID=UPI003EBCAE6F